LTSSRFCYIDSCLVKRSRALRGRNPTRDSQAEGRVNDALLPWRLKGARAAFIPPSIERPRHASKNPTAALRHRENYPLILRTNPFLKRKGGFLQHYRKRGYVEIV
jgi:hypothetical protein